MNVAAADFSQIAMSPTLAATLARASDLARASSSNEVALEHLLLSLCDDTDAEAVLTASRVDVARLRSEAIGYLSRLAPAQPTGGLAVSAAASRILEAAAAAARGGRRRDINGAIVLAAIVGDGKSAAAQILQALGLTFDEAIRALQSALAPPRGAVPDFRPADDVLARARERVQSRAAPTLRDIMKDLPRPVAPPPLQQQWPPPPMEAPVAEPFPVTEVPSVQLGAPAEQPVEVQLRPSVEPEAAPEPVAREEARRSPPSSTDQAPVAAPAPSLQQPNNNSGYVYPAQPPSPVAAPAPTIPQPQPERSVMFDLGRPTPIATPPPIPSGAPSYSAPPQNRAPQPPPPQTQGSVFAPMPMPSPYHGYGQHQHGQMPGQMSGQMRGPAGPGSGGPIGGGTMAPSRAQAPLPAQHREAKPNTEAGQLAENIPRSMRVARTERVEVRIAKAAAKSITEGLDGGGVAWRHDVTVTQAMSVRLRAPDGGFFIETVSPETQWIENHLGFASDDFASWRFLVTPQARGRTRLQIVVSARTVGGDGMAAETALPDQVVEVKVRTNYKRTLLRWMGWILAAVAGGALAKFGEAGLDIANVYIAKFLH